jgi:hypothetical protein
MWFKELFAGLMTPVTAWVEGSEKRKLLSVEQEGKVADREHEVRLKKVDIAFELAKQGQQTEADWDTNAQNQMPYTWKDEWFVILFSVPLVLAFTPMSDWVLKGFDVLSKCPDWYMWLVVGIVSATFGLRWMFGKISFKGK